MYNSVIVRFLMKIWNALVSWYENSLVKKLGNTIKNILGKLTHGSVFTSIFSDDLDIMENTFIYKVYGRIIDFINKIFGKINNGLKPAKEKSIYINTMDSLFKNYIELIKSFTVFILFFAIGVIVNSFIRGIFLSGAVIGSIVLIVLGLIILYLDNRIGDIIENSWVINFVFSIFKVEEGGDQWW